MIFAFSSSVTPTGNRQLLGLFQMLNEQARVWEKLFSTLREYRTFVEITQPFLEEIIPIKSSGLELRMRPKMPRMSGMTKTAVIDVAGAAAKFTVSQCK